VGEGVWDDRGDRRRTEPSWTLSSCLLEALKFEETALFLLDGTKRFGEGAAISPSKFLLVFDGDDFAAASAFLSVSLVTSPKSGKACRCRWLCISNPATDLGDEEDAVLLTLPNGATLCLGLALFFPGIVTATAGRSLEAEAV
jgi:hypothetical protein